MRTIIVLLAVITTTTASDLPNIFKICKRSDEKVENCLNNAIKDAIVSMANGLKNFEIVPLEPLFIDKSKLVSPQSSPVRITQEYYNTKVHGLTKNLKISNSKWDWDNLIFKFTSFTPRIDYVTDYKIQGNVLLLPINGKGPGKIILYNTTTMHILNHETFQKNGETYLRTKKHSVRMYPEHIMIDFSNLIDGQPVLSEQTNKFINDNANIIFEELHDLFEKAYAKIFENISNNIFSRIPMKDIFPD